MKFRCLSLIWSLALLVMAGTANAKDLFVNGATGDDSVTYTENDSSRP